MDKQGRPRQGIGQLGTKVSRRVSGAVAFALSAGNPS